MLKRMRSLGLSLGLLLAACGGSVYEDNPRPKVPPDDPQGNIGNVWIIGDVSTCSNYDLLAFLSKDACAPTRRSRSFLNTARRAWNGTSASATPTRFPGAEWVKFNARSAESEAAADVEVAVGATERSTRA